MNYAVQSLESAWSMSDGAAIMADNGNSPFNADIGLGAPLAASLPGFHFFHSRATMICDPTGYLRRNNCEKNSV
jgi:hypothetical protein